MKLTRRGRPDIQGSRRMAEADAGGATVNVEAVDAAGRAGADVEGGAKGAEGPETGTARAEIDVGRRDRNGVGPARSGHVDGRLTGMAGEIGKPDRQGAVVRVERVEVDAVVRAAGGHGDGVEVDAANRSCGGDEVQGDPRGGGDGLRAGIVHVQGAGAGRQARARGHIDGQTAIEVGGHVAGAVNHHTVRASHVGVNVHRAVEIGHQPRCRGVGEADAGRRGIVEIDRTGHREGAVDDVKRDAVGAAVGNDGREQGHIG